MSSNLMLHAGSRTVEREELQCIDAPAATDTWFPVPHHAVLDRAEGLLTGAGYQIERARYGLSPDNHRFFGVLDLAVPMDGASGVALAVGIRNSTDKTFPIGLAAGSRVFVCDNLAFSAEMVVTRKHTRFGMDRWTEGIGKAVEGLNGFRQAESRRIAILHETLLSRFEADSLLLRAFEGDILNTRQLPVALAQWREPTYDWGKVGTAWHLYNAMTTALGETAERNPQKHAGLTMKIMEHFSGILGTDGAALVAPGKLDGFRDDGAEDRPEVELLDRHGRPIAGAENRGVQVWVPGRN